MSFRSRQHARPLRDFQRGRLYRWEDREVRAHCRNVTDLSLRQCEALVHDIWAGRAEGMPPRVTDGRGRRSAGASADRRIALPRWSRQTAVVIHEISHCLCARLRLCDKHGPNFVRMYIELLASYAHYDRTWLQASATDHGIKVADRGA